MRLIAQASSIGLLGVVVDPCQSMVGLRYPFFKDDVMACHREKPYY